MRDVAHLFAFFPAIAAAEFTATAIQPTAAATDRSAAIHDADAHARNHQQNDDETQ